MKKLTLLVACTMLLNVAFAGGLLTNYNQSAQYVRMLSRNAALEIDAVFYNPAGLVKMEDGWHFAFYSQTIFQDREVNTTFPLLNDGYYKGETKIPVFPDLYGVYKKDKWAFSLGIGPVGGGGTATFDRGLPSFEIPISKAVPALAGLAQINPALGVTGYSADLSFDGSSTYWGIQLGATYAIDEIFSVYGGVRIMPSVNAYEGAIRNVMLQAGGQMNPASAWLTGAAGTVGTLAAQTQALANMPETLSPYLSVAGSYTLGQLEAANQIDAAMKGGIEAGLKLMGLDQTMIDAMTLNQINGAYVAASPTFQATANTLQETAQTLSGTAGAMEDREVDTKQKGMGLTPIIGINISPNEDWNIGLKYEHKTSLTLKNETEVDDLGLFPDGAEGSYDVPGIITAGVGYRGLKWLEAQLSYNMYLDKGVDYGYNVRYRSTGQQVQRDIDKNYYELGLGLQFNLSDKFAISVGGLTSQNGVTPDYQSDFSFTNSSKTLAGGFMWKITDKLTFDFGILNTFYKDDTVEFTDPDVGKYNETYAKTTFDIAAGISYSIF
uniref:OmpP1/FadL family transporter n=1 Tax=uncultured Draconibacterium sp. TaxID=1573823 RepID=UPI0032177719